MQIRVNKNIIYKAFKNLFFKFSDVTFRLVEGDVLLTPDQQALLEATASHSGPFTPLNAVVNREDYLWRNARIPYIIDSEMSKYNYPTKIIMQCFSSYYVLMHRFFCHECYTKCYEHLRE